MSNSFIPIKPLGAHLPRNAFDLSQRRVFSCATGMLTPCAVYDCNPHDHFDIDLNGFTRLRPLETAAFTKIRQHVEFFFVPYRVLWSLWQSFIVGTRRSDVGLSPSFYNGNGTNPTVSDNSLLTVPMVSLYNALIANKNFTDQFGYSMEETVPYLYNLLGYGGYDYLKNLRSLSSAPDNVPSVNLFRVAAYNRIYNDHFRNDNYELRQYHSDSLDSVSRGLGDTTQVLNFFRPRYALWKKDNVMDVVPTLLYDQVANSVNKYLGGSPTLTANSQVSNTSLGTDALVSGAAPGNTVGIGLLNSQLSTASIRNAFALERLLETTRRAGKDYHSQILAHFGFKSDVGDFPTKSIYLGGSSADIIINEVLGTVNNSDTSLGDIGAKGNSSLNGHIKFDAKEHGVLMGLMYFEPIAMYEATDLDLFNTKLHKEDYFQAETENLGMQPFYKHQLSLSNPTASNSAQSDSPTFVLGWQPRYTEYKTNRDKCFGKYTRGSELGRYVSPRDSSDVYGGLNNNGDYTVFINGLSFHIRPDTLNNIFSVYYGQKYVWDYDEEPTDEDSTMDPTSIIETKPLELLDTFQFDVVLSLNVKAVRDMSVEGMPNVSHMH